MVVSFILLTRGCPNDVTYFLMKYFRDRWEGKCL